MYVECNILMIIDYHHFRDLTKMIYKQVHNLTREER